MSAVNDNALLVNPGIVEIANWNSGIPTLLDDVSNAATVKGALDALTYVRLASVTDLRVSQNYNNNPVEVIADDTGTVYKAVAPQVTITGNWYEVGEVDAIDAMVGQNVLDVAGTPVAVTGEAHGTGWTVGTPFKLTHKNGANTQVDSITVKEDGVALVLNTDYKVYVGDGSNGDLGYTYITPIAAQTGVITVDYTYTPNASQYQGGTIKSITIPQLVVRITSTDSSTGKVKITYLINAGFNGELVQSFVDVARAGQIGNSPFSFGGNRQGQVLYFTDDL